VWWIVEYLNRKPELPREYNSDMIPFGVLPRIHSVSIKLGHTFKTKNILVKSGEVTLHCPTNSIWIEGRDPIHVPGASRIILFKKNFRPAAGEPYHEVHIGLADKNGEGKKVIISRGECSVVDHLIRISADPDFIPEPETNECR